MNVLTPTCALQIFLWRIPWRGLLACSLQVPLLSAINSCQQHVANNNSFLLAGKNKCKIFDDNKLSKGYFTQIYVNSVNQPHSQPNSCWSPLTSIVLGGGSQWRPDIVWLSTLFKMSSLFNGRKKLIQIWNNLNASLWLQFSFIAWTTTLNWSQGFCVSYIIWLRESHWA